MNNKTKHTIESVTNDLIQEYKELSTTEYEECGDVNYKEYGGVLYRKGEVEGEIEVIFYYGSDNLPCSDMQNKHETCCELSELIEGISEIWSFSDVENCGLSIGWAIQSLQQYNGFLELESL